MRWFIGLIAIVIGAPLVAAEKPADRIATITTATHAARLAAAAQPSIQDLNAPSVKAYLLEQQRRRTVRSEGLRQRLDELQRDPAKSQLADVLKQQLADVLKQQLADLELKPLEDVSFDSAYGYSPTTGLVGYSKKVRLLENTSDGKAIILVDNAALVIGGLGTSEYASGKFFGVERAILVGTPRADYMFRGSPKKSYDASLVDLDRLLKDSR